MAKVREKRSRDFQNVWCLKNGDNRVLTNDKNVKKRWKEYFKKFLDKEYPKEALERIS